MVCGYCAKPLQRRLDKNKQPRWLICSNIHCEVGRRSVSLPGTTEYLLRAVFHFGTQKLEKRVVRQQQAPSNRPADPREAELQATINTLKQLDQSLVGSALEKAEQELANLQQQTLVDDSLSAINTERILEHMGCSKHGWPTQETRAPGNGSLIL